LPLVIEDLLVAAEARHEDGAPAEEVDDLLGEAKALLAGEYLELLLERNDGQA
jgi:hypothetical protein